MGMKKRTILFGLSFWIFAACNLISLPPTSQPTIFPSPTDTSTPAASATTIPSLTMLTNYLDNARIVRTDSFDDSSEWNPTNEISNGELLLTGIGGNNWHGLSNRGIFREGNAAVIDFQFTSSEYFEVYFEREPWTTSQYKRFGVYVNEDHSNVNIFTGRQRMDTARLAGSLTLTSGTWYSLLLAVERGGDFLAVLWDPANPENHLQYRELIPNWQGLDWTFRIQVNKGTIIFDDFEVVVFDGMK